MSTAPEEVEATICDACRTIPVAHLSFDLVEPLPGWVAFLRERGIEVVLDDIGRPAIGREMLGELLEEQAERQAEMASRQAERAAARKVPVAAGVPAVDGASPHEAMAASADYMLPSQEFGGGRISPHQEFLDAQLAEGHRHLANARAEAEAVAKAKKILEESAKAKLGGRPEK